MAAYAALMSLSDAMDLLHQIILQSSSTAEPLPPQLEVLLESLRGNARFLRSYLEKSCASQFESEIKDAADRAEGIIRRFVFEQIRSKSPIVGDSKLRSMCHQMERIHDDTISSLVERIDQTVCENVSEEESVGIFDSSHARLIPLARDEVVVGLEDVFVILSHSVFKESSTELEVISILGMGGLGKTTLARKLYNHNKTFELFQVRGWVTVSQDFSPKDILLSLAASIQPYVRYPKERTESIENHVRKNLKGRRFLIVLDDVWSTEAMDFLMRTFPGDGNGSRILLTTRYRDVADRPNPTKPMNIFNMPFMADRNGYELLVRKVFQEEEHCPLELERHLRSIAMACQGLPLAIVLAAGILFASNKSFPEWEYILSKITSANKYDYKMVDSILYLSYRHLPHRLRSCLLYLGAFPEDHEINVSRLTKQLLAQDFLRNSTSSEVEDCLQDLVRRNLVSVLKWKSDNRVKTISLHDMIRDFCLKKAREEKFLHCVTDDDSIDRDLTGRRIRVMFSSDNLKRSCISDDADEARTIMCFGRGWTRNPLTSVGRFSLLKSLDLVNVEIESFPMEVLELLLLRLLSLCHVPELPPSISNLQYLETLMINPRDASFGSMVMTEKSLPCHLCLPYEIWTVPRLRHIISFCCGPLPSPNQENPPLQNLETLSAVMNLDCSNELMRMIPNIKKLGIFYFGVECSTHSIENIKLLRKLEKLKVWVLVPFSSPQNLDLGFPTTLRKLTLRGIQLSERDMHVIGQLPCLEVLKLRRNNFGNDQWAVTSNGFRNLKHLLLEELGLRHWFSDSGSGYRSILPMLQTLLVRACKELIKIPKFVIYIPSLELIEVVRCKNKSLVESARRIERSNFHRKLEVRIKNYG